MIESLKRFWNLLSFTSKFLLVAVVVYFFYLANYTAKVPNFNNETGRVLYDEKSFARALQRVKT